MDFETYLNELNEEKKYKSKPTLGNIIKRDDNEKAIEIPYTISAMLKGLGFKGNRFFYVYKLNKFLIEVYHRRKADGVGSEGLCVLCERRAAF